MTYKLIIILILILLIAGCAPKQPETPSVNEHIDWSQETPESVKARISHSAQNIEILSAFFSLSMSPPPDKMMSSMSGVITIDSRDGQAKVRIQAFHLFGSTLFDMVNTDVTKIYVPRQNTMYISEAEQQETASNGPQTIFANMMLKPSDLVLTGQNLEVNEKEVTLYVEDGWLKLDPLSGLITIRHKDTMDISYAAYTTLSNGSLLPTKINIASTDGSFKASCSLTKISLPESLPETFFELAEYKPKATKKLKDLE